MPYLGNVPAEAYSQMSYQDLTGGSGTSFTLDYPVGNENEIEVFVNNVRQEPTVAYTTAGTALTMTGTIAATDDFYVVFQGKAQQTIGIPEKQTNGDYNFDSGTLFVDAANNRVGIGETSPDRSLHITGTEPSVVLKNSGQGTDLKTWRIYSNSSSLQIGTVDDAFASGQNALEITRDNTDNITGIQFKTGASSEIARFTTSGLTFNGDTASANALDDYETGTFDCSITQGGGTPHTQTALAYYEKVGQFVFVHGQTSISSASGSGGSIIRITLPFAAVAGYRGALSIGINQPCSLPTAAANGYLNIIVELGSTAAYIVGTAPAGGHHHLGIGNVGTGIFSISGCYKAF